MILETIGYFNERIRHLELISKWRDAANVTVTQWKPNKAPVENGSYLLIPDVLIYKWILLAL